MGVWRKFWNLSRRDRILALEAALAITATRFGLLIFGHHSWTTLLARTARGSRSGANPPLEPAESVVRMLNSTSRHLPFRATCLERSLGLWWMLRRRGYDTQLRIGGRIAVERFEAHAWIEHDGTVLNDASGEYLSFSHFQDRSPISSTEVR
jgi:hypothetical protein